MPGCPGGLGAALTPARDAPCVLSVRQLLPQLLGAGASRLLLQFFWPMPFSLDLLQSQLRDLRGGEGGVDWEIGVGFCESPKARLCGSVTGVREEACTLGTWGEGHSHLQRVRPTG